MQYAWLLGRIGWTFLAVGMLILLIAGALAVRGARFVAAAGSARGEVIALVPSPSTDRRGTTTTLYASRVRFTDASGRLVEFTETLSTTPARHRPGERVTVLYDPRHSNQAIIDAFWNRHFAVVVTGGIGGVFVILGLILVLAPRLLGR